MFSPGVEPRQAIPTLPAAAALLAAVLARLDRPLQRAWPWIALAAAWTVFGCERALGALGAPRAAARAADRRTPRARRAGIAAAWETARRFGAATAALLASGLLYGLVYAGVTEARAAHRQEPLAATADALAPYLRPEVPVVVKKGIDRRLTRLLAACLNRLVVERAPLPPYDLVAPSAAPVPNARFMFESGGYAVWRWPPARL